MAVNENHKIFCIFLTNNVHLLKILLNNLISFLFPKLLELIFIHKNTPPKVWNAKMGLKSFFWDTLYLQDWNEC